jgi:cytochrome P450
MALVFGSGVHRCLGSFLARLEVWVLLEAMRERGIRLRLHGRAQRGCRSRLS